MMVHVFLSGQVQGMCVRQNVLAKAEDLDLLGYVRNLSDGRVEVKAWGEKEDLVKLADFCRANPGYSVIKDVEVDWRDDDQSEYDKFIILH